jgi:hypothetical protein
MAGLEASGQDLLDPNQKKDASLTDFDYKVYGALSKIVGKGFLAKDFLGYMVDYLALNQPLVPIGQVVGFSQHTAQAATYIATGEATTSATFTNLATVGPQLTDLPDGQYVVFFGASAVTGADSGRMSIKFGTAEATDTDAIVWVASGLTIPGARAAAVTLSENANTITARYRSNGASVSFSNRWLIAIRHAN